MFKRSITITLCVLLLAGLALLLRLDPVWSWQQDRDAYFYKNVPLLSCIDGYYYLQEAKQITRGDYSKQETLRNYLNTASRQATPSLLSSTLALIPRLLPISLHWGAIITPVAFGLLLLLPILLYSRTIGGTYLILGAVGFAIFSPIYVLRTSIGWLDTDCLNLVLPISIAYLFMQFGVRKDNWRYLALLSGFIIILVYLFWWQMAPGAVFFLGLSPFLLAVLFHYRPPRNHIALFYTILIIIISSVFLFVDGHKIFAMISSASKQVFYILGTDPAQFQNIGHTITEQKKFTLAELAQMIAGHLVFFTVAILGTVLLIKNHIAKILYLAPITFIGALGIFFGQRFSFFLLPLLAIGFGYFFEHLSKLLPKKSFINLTLILTLFLLFWTSHLKTSDQPTVFTKDSIAAMESINRLTPKNAVIWSWWDLGHPLVFWADRATFNDGRYHSGKTNHYIAKPLIANNPRFAANFIHFYGTYGVKGIDLFCNSLKGTYSENQKHLESILALGQTKGKAYLDKLDFINTEKTEKNLSNIAHYFPKAKNPIYVFLDPRMRDLLRLIYWSGTWNPEKYRGSSLLPTFRFTNIEYQNGNPIDIDSFIHIDSHKRLFSIKNTLASTQPFGNIRLIHFDTNEAYNPEKKSNRYHYTFTSGIIDHINSDEMITASGLYDIIYNITGNEIIFYDTKITDTLIFRMFFQSSTLRENPYFVQVAGFDNEHGLWKINSEVDLDE